MNISLILPFRERTDMLSEMFESLISQSADLNNIEVLIMIDKDEPNYEKFTRIVHYFSLYVHIEWFTVNRSDHFTKDYINPLAHMARGRWIIPINDDCDFPTKNWDSIIHKTMHDASRTTRDDILLGLTRDEIPRKNENVRFPIFSSFPVVPKAVVQAQGFLWDERCYVWGPDHIIADVFRRLRSPRRLVSLTHVTIGHNSKHTYRRDVHENYERFREIDAKYKVEIGILDHKETINKLREASET